jgi:myo-inositol-1(or 4)-monophosphatase
MTLKSTEPDHVIPEPIALEAIAIDAAVAAAALIRACYGRPRDLGSKSSPTDVVTQTDLDSESLIRAMLGKATPNAGFVGEEGGTTEPGRALQWVIDPLDGTVNFLYSAPIFAVSIAAAVDGEVVAGAVVDVLREEVFSAHLSGGARCNGQPLNVSGCDRLAAALVATGFSYRSEARKVQARVVAPLISAARDVRAFGSAALEACWVAAGRLDAYYERHINVWDYAAGNLVACEAGARTELPCPENNDLVLITSPGVFDQLRSFVA